MSVSYEALLMALVVVVEVVVVEIVVEIFELLVVELRIG